MKFYDNLNILNIPTSTIPKKDVLDLVKKELLKSSSPLFIATINPSFLVKAQKNAEFLEILSHKTSLNVPDGIGIQLAGEYLSKIKNKNIFGRLGTGLNLGIKHTFLKAPFTVLTNKITGVDLTQNALQICERSNKKVLLVLRKGGLTSAKTVHSYLKNNYPKLKFIILEFTLDQKISLNKVGHFALLLCGLGEFTQEKVILNSLNLVKPNVAIGIGGTFDVLTSNKSNSESLSQYGLSWLSRLIQNPKRIKKILTSVFVFPFLVFVNYSRN
ncbi:hypothetical protein GW755_00175 [bacterium]|nr:hypothetical protein [bacterium]